MNARSLYYAAAGLALAWTGIALAQTDARVAVAIPPAATTTFYLDPLDDAGFVDYAAAVNRELNTPGFGPDHNVFVGLLEQADTEHWDPAHLAGLAEQLDDFFVPLPEVAFIGFDRFATGQGVEPAAAAAERDHAANAPLDPASMPITAAWLDAVGPALDGMARALQRTHYDAPLVRVGPDTPLVHALHPHLVVWHDAGTALRDRGDWRLAAGDTAGATQDLIALRRLAAWVSHGPDVVDGLVSLTLGQLADDLLARLVSHRNFTRPQFAAVLNTKLPEAIPMSTTVDRFARVLVLDTATRAARDPASLAAARAEMDIPEADTALWEAVARVISDPRFDMAGLLMQVNFLYDEMPQRSERETLAAFAIRVERYRGILQRRGPALNELSMLTTYVGPETTIESYRLAESGVYKVLTSLPIVGDVRPLLTAETAQDCQVVTALAMVVQDFGLGRGHYPASLDELTPGYIRTLPSDPGDGAAMRYRVDADAQGFTLYSVGANGEDDGGVDDPVDGDLVFRVRR